MSVSFVAYRPIPSWPPLPQHRPHDSAEAASRLAIENAERGSCVLLLTGVPDRFTPHATISKKPKAIRVVELQAGFEGIVEVIDEFSKRLNNRSSKEWAAGARYRPVVIINDADYFFTERRCGAFTSEISRPNIERIEQLRKLLDRYDGHLIVMAAIKKRDEHWEQVVRSQHWQCHTLSELFAPQRYLSSNDHWCHPATAEPPSIYAYGPIEGSQKKLGCALYADGKDDFRRVRQRAQSKGIWVRMIHKRHYQVWFRTETDFQAAKARLSGRNDVS